MIPQPVSMTTSDSVYVLDASCTISASGDAEAAGALLAQRLRTACALPAPVTTTPGESIDIRIDRALPAEHYAVSVDTDGVVVRGGDAAGALHGAQTLLQLLPPDVHRSAPIGRAVWSLPCVEIVDGPRMRWRGVMLDVARHFFAPREIRRLIDLLAMHKLNVLHLHLTDDQGWRVQIDKHPALTEIGGWRPRSQVGHRSGGVSDARPHGGFYSRDDLREIVAYAELRGVLVVPEIDLPGHVGAAVAAYPELGIPGRAPAEVPGGWGIGSHVLNMRESTVAFCCDVLDELVDIFPSEVIGIGSDECPTEPWQNDPESVARAAELGLGSVAELQGWFVSRLEAHLAALGRRAMGWEEVLDGPPSRADTLVTAWRGSRAVARAAEAGLDVVSAADTSVYLDYRQSDDADEPIPIGTIVDVDTVLAFDPMPDGLSDEAAPHVLGGQANLWTEHVDDPRMVDFYAFPRVSALAEALWRGPGDPDEFAPRLDEHLERLRAAGVEFRPLEGPAPWQRRPDAQGSPKSLAQREAELNRLIDSGHTPVTME
ncbi:beta-N-acetylhexosaminidase [Microbacterium halotolerans]|uniref:beta-N-acetylhexosaminidase n=1 Tax=Microbacterium halotolerans TaxID=246613 RepID=UPI0013C2CAB0|nr:beta-N-acetylhexosaminidase [Microbacterium halotolerans]